MCADIAFSLARMLSRGRVSCVVTAHGNSMCRSLQSFCHRRSLRSAHRSGARLDSFGDERQCRRNCLIMAGLSDIDIHEPTMRPCLPSHAPKSAWFDRWAQVSIVACTRRRLHTFLTRVEIEYRQKKAVPVVNVESHRLCGCKRTGVRF